MRINKCFAFILCIVISLTIMSYCRINAVYCEVLPRFNESMNNGETKQINNDMFARFRYGNYVTTNVNYYEFEKIVEKIVQKNEMEKLRYIPLNPYVTTKIKGKGEILLYGATQQAFDDYFKGILTEVGELRADSVYVSETFGEKYAIGDKIVFDLGDKQINATICGFICKDSLLINYSNLYPNELFANLNGLAIMPIASIFDLNNTIFEYSLNSFDISDFITNGAGAGQDNDYVQSLQLQFLSDVSNLDGIGVCNDQVPDNAQLGILSETSKSEIFGLAMSFCIAILIFMATIIYLNAKMSSKFTLLCCGSLVAMTLLFSGLDYLLFAFGYFAAPPAQTILLGFLISIAVAAVIGIGSFAAKKARGKSVYARIDRRLNDENN